MAFLAALCPGRAQVSLTVSPSSISNLYSGPVALRVAGLTNGERVLVERFIDFNGNGLVDPGEPLNLSFLVSDGGAQIIGGVTNTARPFDLDGMADGIINTQLRYGELNLDELGGHAVGRYVFRVSSPDARFPPALGAFAITNTPFPQSISGRILASGAPLSNALAVLYQAQPGGGATFAAAAAADSSGNYRIQIPAGTYQLAALRPGYVGSLSGGPLVTVAPGAAVSTNLSLTPATSSISAVFQVQGATTQIDGLPILAFDSVGDIASGFATSNGAFHLAVNPGQWSLQFDEAGFLVRGIVPLSTNAYPALDTYSGAVTGLVITAQAATALLYGNIHDASGNPIPNAAMSAGDSSGDVSQDFASDASGNYVAPVHAGTFSIGPDLGDPSLAGYFGGAAVQASLTDGAAIRQDFTLSPTNSLILGFATDSQGKPLPGLRLVGSAVIGGNSYNVSALTGTNGGYALGVLGGGNWSIGIVGVGSGSTPLLNPSFNVGVAPQRSTQENFILLSGSNIITGLVTDGLGHPVGGVNIHASATLNGTNYNTDTLSAANGSYSLPVLDGAWSAMVNTFDLPPGYTGSTPSSANILISGTNETLNFTLVSAAPMPSSLGGRVTDFNDNPLTNLTVIATNSSGASVSTATDSSGDFTLQVTAGAWELQIATADAAQRSLLAPTLSFTVTNGINISGISCLVLPSTGRVVGRALSSVGAPLAGVLVHGLLNLDGTNYAAPLTSTAQDGSFSLPVANGLWSLSLDCPQLSSLGYTCAGGASLNVSGASATATLIGLPPVPIPPLLTLRLSPSGAVVGQIVGEYERTYSLDATATLQPLAWTTILTTNTATNIVTFSDNPAAGAHSRFYRVHLPD